MPCGATSATATCWSSAGSTSRAAPAAPPWTGPALAPSDARLAVAGIAIGPATATPHWHGERLDLGYVVAMALMTKTLDRIQTLVAHNEVRVSLHGSEELLRYSLRTGVACCRRHGIHEAGRRTCLCKTRTSSMMFGMRYAQATLIAYLGSLIECTG